MAAVGGGDGIAPTDGEGPTFGLASPLVTCLDPRIVVSSHLLDWVTAIAFVTSSFPLACAGVLWLIPSTFMRVCCFWFASLNLLCGFALAGDGQMGLLSLFLFNKFGTGIWIAGGRRGLDNASFLGWLPLADAELHGRRKKLCIGRSNDPCHKSTVTRL